ncbi:MAG: Smr/MutS family protein [Patescibacteria group bacterium]
MKSNKQSLNETLLSVVEIDPSLPSLDLHGLSVHEAELEVDHFLSQQLFYKEPVVRIICGAGTGVLADAIWEFVQKHPMVQRANSKGSEIFVVL